MIDSQLRSPAIYDRYETPFSTVIKALLYCAYSSLCRQNTEEKQTRSKNPLTQVGYVSNLSGSWPDCLTYDSLACGSTPVIRIIRLPLCLYPYSPQCRIVAASTPTNWLSAGELVPVEITTMTPCPVRGVQITKTIPCPLRSSCENLPGVDAAKITLSVNCYEGCSKDQPLREDSRSSIAVRIAPRQSSP